MFRISKVICVRHFASSCVLILLLWASGAYCQNKPANPPVDLRNVLDPTRIREAHYKIVLYNQNEDQISDVNVLDREIVRTSYQSRAAIRIIEKDIENGLRKKTVVFVDAKTLMPLVLEESSNGGVVKNAYFDHGKETIVRSENGVDKKTESQLAASIFLSNSFSELLQANDFSKNPVVQFQTVNPGNAPNIYIAERFGEKEFVVSPSRLLSCWLVRFTRVDSSGTKSPAGFRYIDRRSGKVLMYKSDIESRRFFTYQYLFLE